MKFCLMMPGVVVLCANVEINDMSCDCGEGTEINVCGSGIPPPCCIRIVGGGLGIKSLDRVGCIRLKGRLELRVGGQFGLGARVGVTLG